MRLQLQERVSELQEVRATPLLLLSSTWCHFPVPSCCLCPFLSLAVY